MKVYSKGFFLTGCIVTLISYHVMKTSDIFTNRIRHLSDTNIKQLFDEAEHDIMNLYQNRGLCYLPKPKAEADNRHEVLIIHDIMQKPNSIIVSLYIFHIIHPQKQKRSVRPLCV